MVYVPVPRRSQPKESPVSNRKGVNRKRNQTRYGNAASSFQHRLLGIVEVSPIDMAVIGLDGKFLDLNRAALDLHGFSSKEELIGTDSMALVAPEYRDKVAAEWAKTIAGGAAEEIELEQLTRDGRRLNTLVSARRLDGADGKPYGILTMVVDVTERKRAEAARRASEDMLRAVIDNSPDAIYVKDRDSRWLMANPVVLRIVGKTAEEAIGKTDLELYEDPEIGSAIIKNDRDILQSGKPEAFEEVADTPEGRRAFLSVKAPRRDAAGNIIGIIGISRDITQRKHDEDALRQAKEELEQRVRERTAELAQANAYNRGLIEVSLDPLVTIGSDGRITDVNESTEAVTGLPRTALIGTDFSEYFTEPDKAKAGFQQVFREGIVRNYPLEICHRDGHTTPVLYNATVYRNADGKVSGVFAAARDITERRQAEQELRQAHEALALRASQLRAMAGQLTLSEQRERSRLAKILHDHLQQLLVAAKFRTAVLGRGGDELARQATKEVENLIDECIAGSRSLTAELSPPIIHEAGLNAGLKWLARHMTEKQGLFVELEMQEDADLLPDIRVLLFESVRELLFNVVKHAQTRSATVNVRRISDHLRVTVSDEGVGFDPVAISPAGEEGRGFGLFNIRERLEFIGGSLEIDSNLGQGSRFMLTVPVAAPMVKETRLQTTPVVPEARLGEPQYFDPGRRIRILLADDHAIVRQGIANLLADEPDMEIVGEAADGYEAIESTARLLPDVILMDVSMPKLNGVEATRSIRNEFPDIRVIGLSMFEDVERAQAMRDAGAVSYLTKSGEANTLINSIRMSIQVRNKVSAPPIK
jgi:PAS domain S-box-containing protein